MYILEDEFISVRLALLAMVYPDVELCAYIYSSSGHARKYNTYKISVHIVYNIVVDEERTAKLRQHCVENLTFLSERCHNEGFDEDTDPQGQNSLRAEFPRGRNSPGADFPCHRHSPSAEFQLNLPVKNE